MLHGDTPVTHSYSIGHPVTHPQTTAGLQMAETTQPEIVVKDKKENKKQQVKTEHQCEFEKYIENNKRKTAKDYLMKNKKIKKDTLTENKIIIKKINKEWKAFKKEEKEEDNPGEQHKEIASLKKELEVTKARNESLEQDNLKKENIIKRNAYHFKNIKKKLEKLEMDITISEHTKKVKKAEEAMNKQKKEVHETLAKLRIETQKKAKVEAELAKVKRQFNDLSMYKYETELKDLRYRIDKGANHGRKNGWNQREENEHWKEDQKREEERRWRQEEYRREKEEREKAQGREEEERRHYEAMGRRRVREENEEHHEFRR